MSAQQISVFLEIKRGRLAEVTRLLEAEGINIRALALADTADFGVLRLIVSDPAACLAALRRHDFVAQTTDVIAVEVEDKPGGLHRILEVLDRHDFNIEYMYAFVEKKADDAVVVFKIDRAEDAVNVLDQNGVSVLSEGVVKDL